METTKAAPVLLLELLKWSEIKGCWLLEIPHSSRRYEIVALKLHENKSSLKVLFIRNAETPGTCLYTWETDCP